MKKKKHTHAKVKMSDYLFIAPSVLLVGIFFISSILYTFHLSFYEWNGISEKTFAGISNYLYLFQDENFIQALINTIVWVLSSLVTSLLIPLLLAILITRSAFPKIFKNIFYFPATLSSTVGGLVISALLSTYGLPMLLGQLLGITAKQNWMNTPYLNTFLLILSGVWQGTGLNLLLFIAGFRNMDMSPVESAMIDGAHGLKLYTRVILPIIKPTIVVVMLMSIVNSFKVFDIVWVTTMGGPYRTSETLALSMYSESFVYSRYGTGSAIAIILTAVILVFSYFYVRNNFKDDAM